MSRHVVASIVVWMWCYANNNFNKLSCEVIGRDYDGRKSFMIPPKDRIHNELIPPCLFERCLVPLWIWGILYRPCGVFLKQSCGQPRCLEFTQNSTLDRKPVCVLPTQVSERIPFPIFTDHKVKRNLA